MKGNFITLCGGEGAGKSTMALRLKAFFDDRGVQAVLTKEPGGTDIGMNIRKILLSPENDKLDPKAELFLYLADRAQHFSELILPSLNSGKTVISDRFMDSTYVYQGVARNLGREFIESAHRYIFRDFLPDLTIIFDIPPEEGLKRVKKDMSEGVRNKNESRLDLESLKFHHEVRRGFLSLAEKDLSGRFFVVDALKSPDEVFEIIIQEVVGRGLIEKI